MNRRDFLKAMGASVVGTLMPKAQQVKADEKVGFVELTVEVDERSLEADITFWRNLAHGYAESAWEWCTQAADLAVQVAYWQEQYELVREKWEADWLTIRELRKRYEQVKARLDLYEQFNAMEQQARLDHWYQGAWHTDAEWREHLLEQDRNA